MSGYISTALLAANSPSLEWQGWFTISLLIIVLIVLFKEIFPPDVSLLIAGSIPVIMGIVPSKIYLQSFANSTIVTIGMLFIIARAFQDTGLLILLTRKILPNFKMRTQQLLYVLPPLSFFSAFLNNTPLVIMMTPLIRRWALKKHLSPSKYLIPISYAAILGGTCTLIGTSTNLVVNGLLLRQNPQAGLEFFEIGKIGIFCAVAGLLYIIFIGHHLLPSRIDPNIALREEMRKLTTEFHVHKDCPLIGKSIQEIGQKYLHGDFSIIQICREKHKIKNPSPDEKIYLHDEITFVGDAALVTNLHAIKGLDIVDEPQFQINEAPSHYSEAVIPGNSILIGKTLSKVHFRGFFGGSVVAVFREGTHIQGKLGEIVLKAGDILMILSAKPRDEDQIAKSKDIYFLKPSIKVPIFSFFKALLVLAIILIMIIAATFGVSMMVASMAAALLIVILNIVSPREIPNCINWNLLILIAGGMALGKALEVTGVAFYIGKKLLPLLSQNPHAIVAGIFILTATLTELITNTAAALIIFPIALETAAFIEPHSIVAIKAIGITVAIAASCSFLTPIGYQTNTIVYGPGGYHFADYIRAGFPMTFIIGGLCTWLIPLFWPMNLSVV